MSATPQQVRQWSDEVAADPRSRAFLPLAQHYRGLGRGDAAMRLVLRGLERHPHDVEAHYLLGCLYRDAGEDLKAFDEWDIALALSPEHQGARRQIGFLCLRRGELDEAERHLERALEGQFDDQEVRDALERILGERRAGRGRRGDRGQGTGDSGTSV
ncbi:MAG TPA: tetratricopeptide repeat protein, partial [Longimicrobium sp.]